MNKRIKHPPARTLAQCRMEAEKQGLPPELGDLVAEAYEKTEEALEALRKVAELAGGDEPTARALLASGHSNDRISEAAQRVREAKPLLQHAGRSLPEAERAEMLMRVARDLMPVNEVQAMMLNALVDQDERNPTYAIRPTEGVNGVGRSWDHGEGLRERMVAGLLTRMSGGRRDPESGRDYAGASFAELAAECVRANGGRPPMFGRGEDVVRMALQTTSDFALVLSGAVNAQLREGYQAQMSPLFAVATEMPASDFRERNAVRVSASAELERVNQAGEVTRANVLEDGEKGPTVETFAKTFALSRQVLVNDDLQAFISIPRQMAQGAATTTRKIMVRLLEANSGAGPLMRDGSALFDAAHDNMADVASVPSVASLGSGQVAMRRQKGLHGEVLGWGPRFIVVPPELETTANKLVAEITPNTTDAANPFSGDLEVVVEAGLSDTQRWYLAADPALADGLVYAFLDGNDGPVVDTRDGWEILGMELRVMLDFGAAFIDYRSWYTNAGQ
ncbi:MAG: Mu-like prophage major head subunit gpT family protein [Pseudomonadota bacterium]